ncbi:hypothetical protein L6452_01437 [Arctium lappa]|uniref:Uncharacterized protein n=1 Tax=Arctium lappa TaxID=4217 RepID=A0ACB9FGB2_ARCLA|nr:hypothetical protein L6452_01437 [Arctium lappa]
MVSVERIKQFTKIPLEVEWVKKTTSTFKLAFSWRHRAQRFPGQARYRSNMPLVIKGISLSTKRGENIGVVQTRL